MSEVQSEQRKSVYQILREWDASSSEASPLSDSQVTLPPSHSPVFVLASCSDDTENSSLIPNVSSSSDSE